MPSRSDPTDPLRAHLRSLQAAAGQHPPPEQIVAYQERRISPQEADEVRAHLAVCPDCTAQLLELAALFDPEDDPGSEISRADLDSAWQRQRLFPEAAPVVPLSRRPAAQPSRQAWMAPALLGLAAALLAVVALVQWQTIARLRQPQVNPPLVNLAPVGSVRQEAGPVPELRLPADADARVWVILNPVAELNASSYDMEVVAPDGLTVFRLEDLQSSEAANFRLEIPASVLQEGEHRILLTGKKAGRRQALGEFKLRVHLSSPAAP